MNSTQLNRLLKKKGWTGKEVGQLLFSCLFNDIKQQRNEDTEFSLSQSDFRKIESTLTSDRDFIIYGVYRDLYSSTIDSFNRGQGLYQQFYNGFYRLFSELKEIEHTEDAQESRNNTPLIMTESQYNRLEAEAIQILSGYQDSFSSLLFRCLDRFLEAEEEQAKAEAPAIWEALEATKKKPATGNRFVAIYNKAYVQGYYTLPDGRRNDQMTDEEWKRACHEEFLKMHKLTANDELATPEETESYYNQQCLIERYRLFFKGATDEELNAKLLEYITPTTWHAYEEPPEGLTLYDLLYLYIDEDGGELDTEPEEAIKHLEKDAPELYNALKAYIEERVPQARGLKASQLRKKIVSWGELATLGVIGYEELLQPDDREIIGIATREEATTESQSKHLRTIRNGIAILKHPSSSQIDDNGYFIEPEDPLLSLYLSTYSLEGDTDHIERLHGFIENFINPAMSYLYSFNALMEIIGEVYDLPELAEVVTLDTEPLESNMSGFNIVLYTLYHDVYGNEEEKQHKRAIIKEAFDTLEADTLKPSQEAIEEITEELVKLGYSSEARGKLKYLDAFLDRLMNSREGA